MNGRLPGAASDGALSGGTGRLPEAYAAAAAVIGRHGRRWFHTGQGTYQTTGNAEGLQGSAITGFEPFFLLDFSRIAETLNICGDLGCD